MSTTPSVVVYCVFGIPLLALHIIGMRLYRKQRNKRKVECVVAEAQAKAPETGQRSRGDPACDDAVEAVNADRKLEDVVRDPRVLMGKVECSEHPACVRLVQVRTLGMVICCSRFHLHRMYAQQHMKSNPEGGWDYGKLKEGQDVFFTFVGPLSLTLLGASLPIDHIVAKSAPVC